MKETGRRGLATEALVRAIAAGVPLSLLARAAQADNSPDQSRQTNTAKVANVIAAGATGDGKTNDTDAFRTALASGRAVYVPPGTYRISETLKVDGICLFGAGPQSILLCDNPGFNLLTVAGIGTRIHGLSIWGAAVDENSGQFGIVTSTTSPPRDFALTDVRFSGPSAETGLNNGIKFEEHATDCRVSNCHFERLIGKTSGHGYAILTGGVDGLIVNANSFEGSRALSQGRHAVYVSAGGRRVTASNNIVREFNCEAMCTNAYAHQRAVELVVFSQNVIIRSGGEIAANQSSIGIVGKASSIRVEGNIIIESFGCGILCDAGSVVQENIAVDANTVIDSAYMGIRQLGALQQTVRDNLVRGSSRIAPGKWPDIVVGAGVMAPDQILVSGNQCVPSPGSSAKSFMLTKATPLPRSVKIFGNDFPTQGYAEPPDYAVGVLQPVIDGRLQVRTPWQPSRLEKGSIVAATFPVAGAEPGDIVVCSHPGAKNGVVISATVEVPGAVIVVLTNAVGDDRTFEAGTLAIDVWKGSIRSG